MKIEVKNVKFVEAFSEETYCFTASIRVDGKKVGEASNRGHGGETDLIYNDGYPHKSATHKAIKEYCETLPPMQSEYFSEGLEYDPYILIDELIDKEYHHQQDKKLCRGKTAFRMPNHEYESKYEYHILKQKYTPAVKAELIKRYGEGVYILNEHI
tara:strand:+ start:636 stop:1103 length:468 start_codon:yes stop_codon:yes gene_type:complete